MWVPWVTLVEEDIQVRSLWFRLKMESRECLKEFVKYWYWVLVCANRHIKLFFEQRRRYFYLNVLNVCVYLHLNRCLL